MLTGDLNVAIVEWIVQYRVSDPYQSLFKVRDPEGTFRAMNEAVMRQVVGDRTVTEVLTVGRQEIETRVETELQAMAKQYRARHHARPGRAPGRQPAEPRQAILGCRQPGAAAARSPDQRGTGRVQQGRPARKGRSGTGNPAGAGIRARPREPLRRRQLPVQIRLRVLSQGAGRHPPPDVLSRPWAACCQHSAARSSSTRTSRASCPLLPLQNMIGDDDQGGRWAVSRRGIGVLVARVRRAPALQQRLLRGQRDLAGDRHAVRRSRSAPGDHARAAHEDPVHPAGELVRQAVPRVGRQPEPGADQGQALHLGRYLRAAGASSIR